MAEDSVELAVPQGTLGGLPVLKVGEHVDYINAMIYGVPGSGKTYLAGTTWEVEAMRPVLFIDVEGGTKTIRNKYPDIHRIRIIDEYKEGKLLKTAWQKLNDVYEDIRKGVLVYRTIVVDNLSEAYRVSMESVMKQVRQTSPDRDPDIPAMRDWGKSSEQIRRMVRSFRDLDSHVIFTAHENVVKADDGKVTVQPSLPGKLAVEIPGYLDEVLYLYARPTGQDGEVERKLLSQPTGKYIAKDRSGRLPTTMADPTMSKVAELVLD